MTFEYSAVADVMLVSLSEPSSPCVYEESQTPGVILRIEDATGIIRGFEILVWSRRIARGPILIPEVSDQAFQEEWIKKLSLMRADS